MFLNLCISEKKSPLLAFIKFGPTFLTGSLAVCLSAPVPAFTQEFRSDRPSSAKASAGKQGEAGPAQIPSGLCGVNSRGLGGIFTPYFERSEIVAGPPAEPREFRSDFFKYTPHRRY